MNATTAPVIAHPPVSRVVWTIFLLLCFIAVAAALQGIGMLALPLPAPRDAALSSLNNAFTSRRALTLAHIVPALFFALLLPAWFSRRIRSRVQLHRRVTQALFILGVIIGVTALFLSLHPVGGLNEASAAVLYDSLFLFCLARSWMLWLRSDLPLHREWMTRAIAILLGIATTRPVMGVFFATRSITHLTLQQFFGIAFWIGFTTTYIAGEAWLRAHPAVQNATAVRLPSAPAARAPALFPKK
jgi:hypothetical protein